jgi:hypothetical protein
MGYFDNEGQITRKGHKTFINGRPARFENDPIWTNMLDANGRWQQLLGTFKPDHHDAYPKKYAVVHRNLDASGNVEDWTLRTFHGEADIDKYLEPRTDPRLHVEIFDLESGKQGALPGPAKATPVFKAASSEQGDLGNVAVNSDGVQSGLAVAHTPGLTNLNEAVARSTAENADLSDAELLLKLAQGLVTAPTGGSYGTLWGHSSAGAATAVATEILGAYKVVLTADRITLTNLHGMTLISIENEQAAALHEQALAKVPTTSQVLHAALALAL